MRTTHSTDRLFGNTLIQFLKLLCGEYSNEKQALDNPPLYSHILISYRPLPHLEQGSLLLHQAYAVAYGSPYRLRVVQIRPHDNGGLKVWNHKLRTPERFYTAINNATLRAQISPEDLILLRGCHYTVYADADSFRGSLEKGCRCLVQRNGQETYLVSEFKLSSDGMKTIDRGYDVQTHKYLWGSVAGAFCFRRTVDWSTELPQNWLIEGSSSS